MDIIAVPAIASVVFTCVEVYKKIITKAPKHEETLLRIIPVISTILGVIGGIVCFFAFPSIIAATDAVGACIVGGASGLSATGCNQIIKQLKKYGINVRNTDEEQSDGV